MSAKQFLLQECRNLQDLLNATLRNEYGLDGSREFFEECSIRLECNFDELSLIADTDDHGLTVSASEINELAKLICRIERSSLGEYSWPFVEELKEIANAICTEDTLEGKDIPPKVYVLADGGLDSYAIYPEKKRPSRSKRLILTIVFPKTLKDFVLLHSILGHELGHAIWRCSKHQGYLRSRVISKLVSAGGVFADAAATTTHLYLPGAPQEAKDRLAWLQTKGIGPATFFQWADWNAWIEEILCDLIGLVTFGPSFAAAHCELLYALHPSGISIGREHPPVSWRVNMILRCAELLTYDNLPDPQNAGYQTLRRFWDEIRTYRSAEPWHDVFSDAQLRDALTELTALLANHSPCAYPSPSFESMADLLSQLAKNVPPTGCKFSGDGKAESFAVDFRHILYAGWAARLEFPPDKFDVVNRLCQHAIMQQRAIDIYAKRKVA